MLRLRERERERESPPGRGRAIFHRAEDTDEIRGSSTETACFLPLSRFDRSAKPSPRNPRRFVVRNRVEIISYGSRSSGDCLVFFEAVPPVAGTYRDILFSISLNRKKLEIFPSVFFFFFFFESTSFCQPLALATGSRTITSGHNSSLSFSLIIIEKW